MKRPIRHIVLSLLLVLVMLVNIVACSGFGNVITNDKHNEENIPAGNEGGNEDGNGSSDTDISSYPTIPVAVLSFSGNPAKGGTAISQLTVNQVTGFNVNFSADDNVGIKSYKVGNGIEVTFDTYVDRYMVSDAITVDDEIALEQLYYHGEADEGLALDEIYADYYSVEIEYTDTGKVGAIYYVDSYYIFEYDEYDRVVAIYCDSVLFKSFTYSAQNKIVKETTYGSDETETVRTYSYTESGRLFAIDGTTVDSALLNGNTISVGAYTFTVVDDSTLTVSGGVEATLTYGYEFNGVKYLTSKCVDGVVTNYAYLGDKVVGIQRGDESLYYILDNDLNYIGLKYNGVKYYFGIDPYGNVMQLMDCDGNVAVEYSYDIWGTVIGLGGELADTLGAINEVTNLSGVYDFTMNVHFIGTDVYLPTTGTVLSFGAEVSVSDAIPTYEWNSDSYFARSAVTDFAKIHDKVVSVAIENLKEAGLDVSGNLYATDSAGNLKRLVDIYTVDYSVTPFSAMNLINGNQIYEVIYHSPDSMAFETLAGKKLETIARELEVSYFGEYNATVGTMKFNGQFIYLGYLIDYKCMGNGIVEYQVKVNKKSNYDQTVNIYDYDSGKYVCYVNNTFDLDFLDGVTIIPGISKETFEVIEGYLGDYLQAVAGDICDQMLIYDDPTYYNTADMNVYPDYWSQINLTDTTTYLEMQTDGSIKVSTMPAYETDGFKTKLLIGAGVILVTAVVATVAIMIPGANCVVVSICVGMAKGAVTGALSGFAFGAIMGAGGEFIGQITSGKDIDWNAIGNSALSSAADGFASGAITGAIMGGISGGLNPKYCFEAGTPIATENGLVAIEDIAVGDMVWSYNYQTGEKSLQTVTATTERECDKVVSIDFGAETIVTTPEHPFYVVNNDTYDGYVAAKHLSVGDEILTSDGGYQTISAIETHQLDEPIAVYNLSVDVNHSYYVGESEMLVHNVSCGTQNEKIKTAAKNGREMHSKFDYGYDQSYIGSSTTNPHAPVIKEVPLGSAGRADCVDFMNHIVYEMKPDNPRAIARGIKQLQRYKEALEGAGTAIYNCRLALYSPDGVVRIVQVFI